MTEQEKIEEELSKCESKIDRCEGRAYAVRCLFGWWLIADVVLSCISGAVAVWFGFLGVVMLGLIEAKNQSKESREYAKYVQGRSKLLATPMKPEISQPKGIWQMLFLNWEISPMYIGSLFVLVVVILANVKFESPALSISEKRHTRRAAICKRCERVCGQVYSWFEDWIRAVRCDTSSKKSD